MQIMSWTLFHETVGKIMIAAFSKKPQPSHKYNLKAASCRPSEVEFQQLQRFLKDRIQVDDAPLGLAKVAIFVGYTENT